MNSLQLAHYDRQPAPNNLQAAPTDGGEVLIRAENVSKKFCRSLKKSLWYGVKDIVHELNPLARHSVHRPPHDRGSLEDDYSSTLRNDEFWAVKDVSFELRRGECLGLIGHNGAGKTTLLKMLNGLIKPDSGRIEMRGRVGALIALGAGFNPILTGRENIYVNGSVLGLTKREIDDRVESIIEFSEIGRFIDAPVQSYSSGMAVRLGFAVAVNMKPDILLIDEVLAVGDVGFKQKAYAAIYDIIKTSAVIFVSHSISQVGKVCTHGMLLRKGSIVRTSRSVSDVIDGYFQEFQIEEGCRVSGTGRATLHSVSVESQTRGDCNQTFTPDSPDRDAVVAYGSDLKLTFSVQVDPAIDVFSLWVTFVDMEMKAVAQCFSINSNVEFKNQRQHSQVVTLTLPSLMLNKGVYELVLRVCDKTSAGLPTGETLCLYEKLLNVQVRSEAGIVGGAPVQLQGIWAQGDY